jgi:hypothetical protein
VQLMLSARKPETLANLWTTTNLSVWSSG